MPSLPTTPQVWAIAEGRGAAAAADKFLKDVQPSTDASAEVTGGISTWKEYSQGADQKALASV